MNESNTMKELRDTRDKISDEIKQMSLEEMKSYFRKTSDEFISEINKIRESKKKVV